MADKVGVIRSYLEILRKIKEKSYPEKPFSFDDLQKYIRENIAQLPSLVHFTTESKNQSMIYDPLKLKYDLYYTGGLRIIIDVIDHDNIRIYIPANLDWRRTGTQLLPASLEAFDFYIRGMEELQRYKLSSKSKREYSGRLIGITLKAEFIKCIKEFGLEEYAVFRVTENCGSIDVTVENKKKSYMISFTARPKNSWWRDKGLFEQFSETIILMADRPHRPGFIDELRMRWLYEYNNR